MIKSLFIERLDGQLVNISLIETIIINPVKPEEVVWIMRNGEKYREDFLNSSDAQDRYNQLKGLLLGTTVAQLEDIIVEQSQVIVQKNEELNEVMIQVVNLNGEEV